MRVGILTMFHGSTNYGGVLQACALCRALIQQGISAEQVRCDYAILEEKKSHVQTLKKLLNPGVVFRRIRYELKGRKMEKQKAGRREAFAAFNRQHVPSSRCVYDSENLRESLADYDAFVAGSDQIWNPEWYCPSLFLDFVPSSMPKVAYAASIGKSRLEALQQERFREHLKDFQAISVREPDAVEMIQNVYPGRVMCTLDPTLLLSAQQWDEVCAERLLEEPYVFCYFLGSDTGKAAQAEAYARKRGLILVNIPFITPDYSSNSTIRCDRGFPDASPAEFLSLIKHADCVFTDSFHATVFSSLYQKEHFTFPREGHSGMSSRIYRLTDLFGTADHFCDTPEKAQLVYMDSVAPIDYSRPLVKLEQMRDASLNFLNENLRAPNQGGRQKAAAE